MKKINNFSILFLMSVIFLNVINTSQKNKSKRSQSIVTKKKIQPPANNDKSDNNAVSETGNMSNISDFNNNDSLVNNDNIVDSNMTREQAEEQIKKNSTFTQITQKLTNATKKQLLSLAVSLVMGGTTILWALGRAKEYFTGAKKNIQPSKVDVDKMLEESKIKTSTHDKNKNDDDDDDDDDFDSVTSEDKNFDNESDFVKEDDEQDETNKLKTNKEKYEEFVENNPQNYVTPDENFSGDLSIKQLKGDSNTSSIMSDTDGEENESDFKDEDDGYTPEESEKGSNDSNSFASQNINDDRKNDFDEQEKNNEQVNNVKEDNIKQQEPKVVEEPKKGFLKDTWDKFKGGASSVKDGMLNALSYVNPFAGGKNNKGDAEPNIVIKKPLADKKPKNYQSKDDMDIPSKKQNTGNVNNPRRSSEEGDARNNDTKFFNSEKREEKFDDLPQEYIHKPGDQDKFVINDPNQLLNELPKSTAQNTIEKHQTKKITEKLKNGSSFDTINELPEDENEENDDQESASDTNSTISNNDKGDRIKEDFDEENETVVDDHGDLIQNFKTKLTKVKSELRSKITNNEHYHGSLLKQYQKVCDLLSLDGDFIKKNFSDEDIDNFMKSENNNEIDILFNKATEKGFVSKTDYLKDIIKDNIIDGNDKTLEWDKVVPKKLDWKWSLQDDVKGKGEHIAIIKNHIKTHKINTAKSEQILNSFYSKSKDLTPEMRSHNILRE